MSCKKVFILIMTIILMIIMVACSSEKEIVGSWYTSDLKELVLTEDGIFSHDDEGGTYTYDGKQIILLYNYGETEIFEIAYEDDGMILINTSTSIESYKNYYPYEVAYELYEQKQQAAEEERTSTVSAIREYLVGTWVGDGNNPLHNYVVEIYDNYTFTIISDDCYYEDTSHAGLEGTWSFEQDGSDQRYLFTAIYPSAETDRVFSKDKFFYIPDWEDRDLSNIELYIYDVNLTKQE